MFTSWVRLDLGLWTRVGTIDLMAHLYEAFGAIWIEAFAAIYSMTLWSLNVVVIDFMLMCFITGSGDPAIM